MPNCPSTGHEPSPLKHSSLPSHPLSLLHSIPCPSCLTSCAPRTLTLRSSSRITTLFGLSRSRPSSSLMTMLALLVVIESMASRSIRLSHDSFEKWVKFEQMALEVKIGTATDLHFELCGAYESMRGGSRLGSLERTVKESHVL